MKGAPSPLGERILVLYHGVRILGAGKGTLAPHELMTRACATDESAMPDEGTTPPAPEDVGLGQDGLSRPWATRDEGAKMACSG